MNTIQITVCSLAASLLLSAAALANEGFRFEDDWIVASALQAEEAQPAEAAEPGAAEAPAEERPWYDILPKEPRDYVGGRGLITIQGMSGMFNNPTSGTLGEGQFTIQYCTLLVDPFGDKQSVGHGIMAAYGVTDWLEVGGFTNWVTFDNDTTKTDDIDIVGGPFFRVRLLKDEDAIPEVSIGFIYLDGDQNGDRLARTEFFVAASKYFHFDDEAFIRGFRLHGGFRNIWRPEGRSVLSGDAVSDPAYDLQGYIGGELELPWDLWAVAEVGNKTSAASTAPYAIGVQYRPNNVVGLSVAALQNGNTDGVRLYIGVGLNFEF